jgi:hypothetical protein
VDSELEALQTSATCVRDSVLDKADMTSSLAVSLSMVVELLEARVDIAATNGVHWGTRSVVVAALSHFLELEMLMSGRNAVLTEDQVDALWILARLASNLLASYVLPSVAHNPPGGAGSSSGGSLCY